jgi:hypothetical protein
VNNPQPIHTDTERAKAGPFGTVITSGFQIAALAMRMFIQVGSYGAAPEVGMGIDEPRWLKPDAWSSSPPLLFAATIHRIRWADGDVSVSFRHAK